MAGDRRAIFVHQSKTQLHRQSRQARRYIGTFTVFEVAGAKGPWLSKGKTTKRPVIQEQLVTRKIYGYRVGIARRPARRSTRAKN
jgi:hypothetical protein